MFGGFINYSGGSLDNGAGHNYEDQDYHTTNKLPPGSAGQVELIETIYGDISPKSVVASGEGLSWRRT